MEHPVVTTVIEGSPADLAGVRAGDRLVTVDGRAPTDVIEYQQLVDGPDVRLVVLGADGAERDVPVHKGAGEPIGLFVESAVFDRVRTCDNHCPFCFIYQLPKGMRRSLYVKDDDYRLSFLYGNFTTLTRFTELDVERVVTERLSPLYVSIHTTDPDLRATMLRNPRGATSLRWLEVLLDAGVEVHGQVVLCPGINDGPALERTLLDVLDRFDALASLGVVPLGLSDFSKEPTLRAHTREEAAAAIDTVSDYQDLFLRAVGRRCVHAADELYLVAERELPSVDAYDSLDQAENGIGQWADFARGFERRRGGLAVRPGFFQAIEGAPALGYRAPHTGASLAPTPVSHAPQVVVLTGAYAAPLLDSLLYRTGVEGVDVVAVKNEFFGGNIAVAGLLCGGDVAAAIARDGREATYLLPDACLTNGRFLDGMALEELDADVRTVATDGASLRRELETLGRPQ
jgi:putative radical SAM enzyme (TIGR03279 family)